jgi:serine/threonine protein phosphatase PrpC
MFRHSRCLMNRKTSLMFSCRTVSVRPHSKKKATGGEDSYLLADTVLSVADGVSWWTEQQRLASGGGVAPSLVANKHSNASGGLFAEEMMRTMCSLLREELGGETDSAVALMRRAYDETCDIPDLVGTTTVSVACLTAPPDASSPLRNATAMLDVATLGDCPTVVYRDGQVIFRTDTLSHAMDFPYQLGSGSRDRPEDALVRSVSVQEGDVVVMGSDGLFDNLFEAAIIREVRAELHKIFPAATASGGTCQFQSKPTDASDDDSFNDPSSYSRRHKEAEQQNEPLLMHGPQSQLLRAVAAVTVQDAIARAAHRLADSALSTSQSRDADTPYARHWLEQGAEYPGGKQDDITVVIAVVGRNPFSDGERLSKDDFRLPPPYKNWP